MSGTSGTDDTHETIETTALDLIEEQAEASIRRQWHDGRWLFSVIDVMGLLTESQNLRNYGNMLKARLRDEGASETYTECVQLRMTAADGKQRLTDAADAETLLRIIQSVPSPKAEPVKQWLARVGAKRLEEVTQPLPASDAATAIVSVPKPAEAAPALAWAEYYEHLAVLYRRAAAYEAQLAYVDAKLDEHDAQLDELQSRVEGVEEGMRLLPEILERLGPQTLTPEHQATVKTMAKRLSDLSGMSYAAIYGDLNAAFHVGRYSDLPDARWAEITAWFERRITAALRRQ